MIRHLQSSEVDLMVENAKRFFEEGKLPGGLNPDVFTGNWRSYITDGRGVVFASFAPDGRIRGALGALFYSCPFNGDPVAVEQFWYMDPEQRGAGLLLLNAFIAFAKNQRGCKRVMMVHLESLQPEILKSLYVRKGFQHIESSYVKTL